MINLRILSNYSIIVKDPIKTSKLELVESTYRLELISKTVNYNFFLKILYILLILSGSILLPLFCWTVSYTCYAVSFYPAAMLFRFIPLILEDMKFWNKKYKRIYD